jgi:ketosteroid isomerase-like protein
VSHDQRHEQDRRSTRTVVEELLRRIGTADPAAIAELYADECDWAFDWPESEHGRSETPWIRHRSSGQEAAEHFAMIGQHHLPEAADTQVERILIDGDHAVVLGEIRQSARSTGRPYRSRFALHLTVEDGRISRHHVYEDSLAVAQAFATSAN